MTAAIGWGALAASALLLGALIAYHLSPTPGVIASRSWGWAPGC